MTLLAMAISSGFDEVRFEMEGTESYGGLDLKMRKAGQDIAPPLQE